MQAASLRLLNSDLYSRLADDFRDWRRNRILATRVRRLPDPVQSQQHHARGCVRTEFYQNFREGRQASAAWRLNIRLERTPTNLVTIQNRLTPRPHLASEVNKNLQRRLPDGRHVKERCDAKRRAFDRDRRGRRRAIGRQTATETGRRRQRRTRRGWAAAAAAGEKPSVWPTLKNAALFGTRRCWSWTCHVPSTVSDYEQLLDYYELRSFVLCRTPDGPLSESVLCPLTAVQTSPSRRVRSSSVRSSCFLLFFSTAWTILLHVWQESNMNSPKCITANAR